MEPDVVNVPDFQEKGAFSSFVMLNMANYFVSRHVRFFFQKPYFIQPVAPNTLAGLILSRQVQCTSVFLKLNEWSRKILWLPWICQVSLIAAVKQAFGSLSIIHLGELLSGGYFKGGFILF